MDLRGATPCHIDGGELAHQIGSVDEPGSSPALSAPGTCGKGAYQKEQEMSYSTIYDLAGNTITDGVQSQRVCDATINTARLLARDRGRSVVVEDRGTEESYRVTPAGHIWRVPKNWGRPSWEEG